MRSCRNCHDTGRVGGLTDPRSRRAVVIAEAYADGLATEEELAATRSVTPSRWGIVCLSDAAGAAAWAVTHSDCPPAAQAQLLRCIIGNPFRAIAHEIPGALGTPMVRWDSGRVDALQAAEQMRVAPLIVRRRWLTPDVLGLAQSAYDDRAWDRLPILADCLEEAGCRDEDVLMHCRGLQRCPKCLGSGKDHVRSGGYTALCVCAWESNPDRIIAGWVPAPLHARGCHVLDLLTGKE